MRCRGRLHTDCAQGVIWPHTVPHGTRLAPQIKDVRAPSGGAPSATCACPSGGRISTHLHAIVFLYSDVVQTSRPWLRYDFMI